MIKKTSFRWSDEVEPHKGRTKAIIRQHPEIRELIGRNPYTFLIITFCVGVQVLMAWLLKDAAWYWLALAAYGIGAFACHSLFVCIHECSHNLVFKNRMLNMWAGMFANLPLMLPSSVSFQRYHLKHHSYQGVEALDADMPFRWEAKLINNSSFGKALWLLFYPVFQGLRPFRLTKEMKIVDGWTIVNWVVEIAFVASIAYFLGGAAIIYLILSFFFSVGLHPLGARWVQEHFLTHGDQETKSYYGRLNVVNLNVGYHNEHHDFPSVPWNKLPQVKAIAGKHYDELGYHTSYTRLLFEFLLNRDISVYSRTARDNRGGKATDKKTSDTMLTEV